MAKKAAARTTKKATRTAKKKPLTRSKPDKAKKAKPANVLGRFTGLNGRNHTFQLDGSVIKVGSVKVSAEEAMAMLPKGQARKLRKALYARGEFQMATAKRNSA